MSLLATGAILLGPLATNALADPTGSISTHAYHDLDGNGSANYGPDGKPGGGDDVEPGLPGWTIFLDMNLNETLDPDEPSGVSDDNGNVTFPNLEPGFYLVCEVLDNGSGEPHEGWFNSDPGGAVPCAIASAPDGGQGFVDFGNLENATVAGRVFHDLDADGTDDAGTDPGLEGYTVAAYVDSDRDGVLSADEFLAGPAASAVSGVNGRYGFALNPGSFILCEALQIGWDQTAPEPGTGACTGDVSLFAAGYAVTPQSGSGETGLDFGNVEQTGKVEGTAFEDMNADGSQGGSDPGVGEFTIDAFADDGDGSLSSSELAAGRTDSGVTNGTGAYSLTLDPGDYVVCEEHQNPWIQSAPGNSACDLGGSGLEAGGYGLSIAAGQTTSGLDFGSFRTGTISGVKFDDADQDGSQTSGEAGLNGWEIRAYADVSPANGVLDATEIAAGPAASETTASVNGVDGVYELTLYPGDYVVCEVRQDGFEQSAPGNTNCASGGPQLADGGFAVAVSSNSSSSGNDFANFTPVRVPAGCAPDFWRSALGSSLWNSANDPDWSLHGGVGTNPFTTSTQFDAFFTSTGRPPTGQTTADVLSYAGNNWARRAQRDAVAAYLNASFGLDYPATSATIVSDWDAAVAGGTKPAYDAFHATYSAANALGCPIV